MKVVLSILSNFQKHDQMSSYRLASQSSRSSVVKIHSDLKSYTQMMDFEIFAFLIYFRLREALSWFPWARLFISKGAKIALLFFERANFCQFWSSTAPVHPWLNVRAERHTLQAQVPKHEAFLVLWRYCIFVIPQNMNLERCVFISG